MYTTNSIENFVLTIMALIVIALFIGAVYAFLMSIFQFIFSKWESEKIKKAWNNIRYMILWIILSFFLLFIFPFAFQRLEIPWYEIYTAKNVFDKASELIQKVLYWESNTTSYWSTRQNRL